MAIPGGNGRCAFRGGPGSNGDHGTVDAGFRMIRFAQGNLLDADVEAVVNAVNTVRVLGKGIALMFSKKSPESFEACAHACAAGEVRLGKMCVTENRELLGHRLIIGFRTKSDWRKDQDRTG